VTKRDYDRRNGIKLSCPECGEGLDGKLSKNSSTNIAPEGYRCGKCENEWFPDELKQEEYKTAVFKGADGEYHFVAMTDKLKADYRERGVWDPDKHPNRYRRKNTKGKYAGGMNKNDVNMLKRLRKE